MGPHCLQLPFIANSGTTILWGKCNQGLPGPEKVGRGTVITEIDDGVWPSGERIGVIRGNSERTCGDRVGVKSS